MKVRVEEEPGVLHAGLRAGATDLLGRGWPGGGRELATYVLDVDMCGAIIIVLPSIVVANYLEIELRVPRITSIILDSIKRLW